MLILLLENVAFPLLDNLSGEGLSSFSISTLYGEGIEEFYYSNQTQTFLSFYRTTIGKLILNSTTAG